MYRVLFENYMVFELNLYGLRKYTGPYTLLFRTVYFRTCSDFVHDLMLKKIRAEIRVLCSICVIEAWRQFSGRQITLIKKALSETPLAS